MRPREPVGGMDAELTELLAAVTGADAPTPQRVDRPLAHHDR